MEVIYILGNAWFGSEFLIFFCGYMNMVCVYLEQNYVTTEILKQINNPLFYVAQSFRHINLLCAFNFMNFRHI